MSRFLQCLEFILASEGGFVDNPADRGGATNRGITQSSYDQWRRERGQPVVSVRQISLEEIEAIYMRCYWTPIRGDRLPAPLDLAVFDAAVNSGPRQALKWLQRALGIPDDGMIGPQTIAAARSCDSVAVADRVVDQRRAFLADIVDRDPSQQVFVKGWLSRLAQLDKEIGRVHA